MKEWELLQKEDRETHPIKVIVKQFPGEYGYAAAFSDEDDKWHVIFADGIEGNFNSNDCQIIN